jgi:diadenosine tetraphosphate (Ap4A) HIT family hydrolase
MSDFELHPRLRADCHRVGRLTLSEVLLHRNAAVPWFILVPRVRVTELCDLEPDERRCLQVETDRLSRLVRARFEITKLNVAAIGNLVAQLHVHVVGRRPGDPCWPNPVWGFLEIEREWSHEDVAGIAESVAALHS